MPRFCSLLVLLLATAGAAAGDWPQWLGPNRDASSTEKVAPWKEPPKVVWRQPVGEGHSSPIVAGGRVYLHAKVKDKDEEELAAFDGKTGEPLWRTAYPRRKQSFLFGQGPRGTPVVAGGRVYTFGITGVLSCFDADKGKQLWQFDTVELLKAPITIFGASCSPLVEDGKVLVNVGAPDASVVAFDAEKGNIVWKALDEKASYASPIVFDQAGQRQAVFLTHDRVVSLRPADGKLFWSYPFRDAISESSSTPVRNGDTLVVGSITLGSAALRLKVADGKPAVEEAWKNAELTMYFSTPVFVGADHLYAVTGTRPPALRHVASLRCIDVKTGKVLWQRPNVGKYHATLLRTADNKLLLMEEAGSLVLLDPDPKEYRELARAKVSGETWAHPALADGRLYVRDARELICLQLQP